jgi:1-deoxy-D-xylulose-5-phosphate reductoisomerase
LFPAAVNAANEKANELFREGKIAFLDIPKAVEAAFDCVKPVSDYTLGDVFETDSAVRKATERLFI